MALTAILLALGLWSWPPGKPTLGRAASTRNRTVLGAARGTVPVVGAVSVALVTALAGGGSRSPLVSVAVSLAAATGWLLGRDTLRSRRRRIAAAATLDAVRALGRELAAGGDLGAALAAVLPHAGESAHPLLMRLAATARYDDAYPDNRVSAVDPLETALFAALRMSRQFGVPLAGLMSRIADGLADERTATEQRATEVAGARLSGYLLAGLPAIGVLLGLGMGADPIPVLLGGGVGSVLLVVGVALSCAGLLWSARIAR